MMIAIPGPRPALLAAVLVTLAAALFYREHRSRDGEVQRLMDEGASEARARAERTMVEVRRLIGISG